MSASDRLRQLLALVMGGLFVATGLVVMFGDPANPKATSMQTAPFYEMVRDLTGLLGAPAAGGIFIVFGLVLTVLLFRAVRQ